MEIVHRVGFNGDSKPGALKMVKHLQISYDTAPLPPPHKIGIVYFDVTESDPRWNDIASLIAEYQMSDVFNSTFNETEILQAEWNRLIPTFEKGYPQPENRWKQLTYETNCSKCGHGGRQTNPFRIKSEPRLGKQDFMTLSWTSALLALKLVCDEFRLQDIQGYELWDVLIHKTGTPSQKVSQLYISGTAHSSMIPEDTLEHETCIECQRTKFMPHMRGVMAFDGLPADSSVDIVLSQEWFGAVRSSYREILVSRRLTHLVIDRKWSGVVFKPIAIT